MSVCQQINSLCNNFPLVNIFSSDQDNSFEHTIIMILLCPGKNDQYPELNEHGYSTLN